MADVFIIKKPWITDKSVGLNQIHKYAFLVSPRATKPEVKKALKEIYKVDAVAVNIVNRPPKTKSFRGLKSSHGAYKKAIVTLKSGQKIDIQ